MVKKEGRTDSRQLARRLLGAGTAYGTAYRTRATGANDKPILKERRAMRSCISVSVDLATIPEGSIPTSGSPAYSLKQELGHAVCRPATLSGSHCRAQCQACSSQRLFAKTKARRVPLRSPVQSNTTQASPEHPMHDQSIMSSLANRRAFHSDSYHLTHGFTFLSLPLAGLWTSGPPFTLLILTPR